jgi:hypothetical protein
VTVSTQRISPIQNFESTPDTAATTLNAKHGCSKEHNVWCISWVCRKCPSHCSLRTCDWKIGRQFHIDRQAMRSYQKRLAKLVSVSEFAASPTRSRRMHVHSIDGLQRQETHLAMKILARSVVDAESQLAHCLGGTFATTT